MSKSPAPPKWSLSYQAWRIKRLQELTTHLPRKAALEQLAAEEIDAPWRDTPPLPPLNPYSPHSGLCC